MIKQDPTSAPAAPAPSGGPTFPIPGLQHDADFNGMTLRQYAAIKLKVPDSGTDWLDDMIRKSLQDDFAAKAMPEIIRENNEIESDDFPVVQRAVAREAYQWADAMLKAREAS